MTYPDIIAQLVGRIERGVTQRTQIGRDSQWQRVTLCLELHRLLRRFGDAMECYPLLRLLAMKLYGTERDKAQLKTDMNVYHQLEAAFGDGDWPEPSVTPYQHRLIANALRDRLQRQASGQEREAERRRQQKDQRSEKRDLLISQVLAEYPTTPNRELARKYKRPEGWLSSIASQHGVSKIPHLRRIASLRRQQQKLLQQAEKIEHEIQQLSQ